MRFTICKTLFAKFFSIITLWAMVSSTASAGFVTLHETEINDIFSQANFGSDTIEVRFNATQEVTDDDLVIIDSESEITDSSSGLLSLSNALTSDLSIAMFYLDDILFCGGSSPSAVGCAARFTSSINGVFDNNYDSFTFFDSTFVSGSLGAHTIAHELAHVFGLTHVPNDTDTTARDNLLNPVVASDSVTTLTTDQINTIFDTSINALIQTDSSNGQLFIEVSPIAILASVTAVPEPTSIWLLSIGMLFMVGKFRRL